MSPTSQKTNYHRRHMTFIPLIIKDKKKILKEARRKILYLWKTKIKITSAFSSKLNTSKKRME